MSILAAIGYVFAGMVLHAMVLERDFWGITIILLIMVVP